MSTSTSSLPPPDTERASSTSSVSSTTSTDSLIVTSPPARKKSFLSSLFHKKEDTPHTADQPHAESEPSTAAATATVASETQSIATPATERQSSTGSESSITVAVEPAVIAAPHTASECYSAAAKSDDSIQAPSSQVLTIAQLVSSAPVTASSDVAPATSPPSATSSSAASATSTPTSVSHSKRAGFFTSLLGRTDTDSQAGATDAKEAEMRPAAAEDSGKTVLLVDTSKEQTTAGSSLQPTASRSRSNSDVGAMDDSKTDLPSTVGTASSSSAITGSKSHADLAGIASSPAPADTGTPGSRRRTLLNTLFKRKGGDEPLTPASPATPSSTTKQQVAVNTEQLTAIVVEAEQQTQASIEKISAQTERTASAIDNLKQLLDESETSSEGRPRAASDSDDRQLPVRLSSHASTVNKGEVDEQPKSGRTEKKKLGSFFSSLRLGKHTSDEQHGDREQKEAETPSPSSTSSNPASASASSSSSSSSSSSAGLDYKARMQQLVERRGGGDRRRSMSDAHRSSSAGGLSQSSSTGQLKGASADVNATMTENASIAARNVSRLQEMENRAAEMEDAADSMMSMAKKIKEDAKKKSLFGW